MNSILVTNDDGQHSPLLLPFIRSLNSTFAEDEIRIVVPDGEQSWVSQSVSRFSALQVKEREFDSITGYTATGTPADCSSLGIHNIYKNKPSYVFSGINMGVNAGLAYFLSSGTVGGASEAMLSHCRSAAFSTEVPRWIYDAWRKQDLDALSSVEDDWSRLAETASKIARQLVESDAWQHASFFSINMPFGATPDTDVQLTRLAETYFGPLFNKVDDGLYRHKHDHLSVLEDISSSEDLIEAHAQGEFPINAKLIKSPPWSRNWDIKSELPNDLEVLVKGQISLTPITYRVSESSIDSINDLIG